MQNYDSENFQQRQPFCMSRIVDKHEGRVSRMDAGDQIDVATVEPELRYIKLGSGNGWAVRAFERQEVPFSHREVPHELALTGDERRIAKHLMGIGRSAAQATNAARQVCAFYGLDDSAIWITFVDGLMWWTRAKAEVTWLGESADYAPRMRKSSGGWRSTNELDQPLFISGLSSRLTKVMSTQTTLCKVEAADYALRKIRGLDEPATLRAHAAKASTVAAAMDIIDALHWADFETLVDLLLARGGWYRVSNRGGNLKDADMIAEQPVTKEIAFIQVKSASDQKEFDRYVEIFDRSQEWHRMIYACHSPTGSIVNGRRDVLVWSKAELAEMVFRQGLFDWVVEKAG